MTKQHETASRALIDFFEQFLPLDENEISLIGSKAVFRLIKRRQAILQDGFPCRHYTFIVKGCFRLYGIDNKGSEHNVQFAAENDWIADIGSFHSGKPSALFIEALEPAEILQIEKDDLYFLYLNIVKLNRIFKVIIENKYVALQNRLLQTFSVSAQQRYLDFLEQHPNLSTRLASTHIASYIGVTPEFLSKVRKDLANEK